MAAENYFAASFAKARMQFHEACRSLQLAPVQIGVTHGMFGGPGGALIEVLRLGDPEAKNLLVCCAGDRLADALCCSGVQVGWLSEYATASLPPGSGVVFLHHGAAPPSGGELPPQATEIPQWDSDVLAKVEERYAEYAREKGVDHMGAPLPNRAPGDGDVPGYATAVLDDTREQLASAEEGRVLLLEFAVGIGPFGKAEITPCHPEGSAGAERIRTWFSIDGAAAQEAVAEHQPDHLAAGLMRRFPAAELYAAGVSFGTFSMMSVLDTLEQRAGDRRIPDTRPLLYPDSPAWRQAVWQNAVIVMQHALAGLPREQS